MFGSLPGRSGTIKSIFVHRKYKSPSGKALRLLELRGFFFTTMKNNEVQIFEFNGQAIEFEVHTNKNVMVNATEMAKVFGSDVFQFTKSEGVKLFIEAALKPANAGLLGIESEADLLFSKQKSGTWMHRVLALKFAAWLDPNFELWIYTTIDKVVYGVYASFLKSLQKTAEADSEAKLLHDELMAENEKYLRLETLKRTMEQEKQYRMKINKSQLDIFRDA